MIHGKTCVCLLCVAFMSGFNFVIAIQQGVSLNSTLIRGRFALPQQEVMFTCETKNSTILEWQSNEYIGNGGDVIPVYSVGSRDSVTSGGNPTTYARRISVTIENGVTIIVSQLYIIASEQYPVAAVTCRINGQGPSKTITFSTTATALQDVMLSSTLIGGLYALPQQRVVFTCTTKNSTILEWQSNEHIGSGGDIIPIYSVGLRDVVASSVYPNTYATRVNVTNEDGIIVIISQLFITATEQFPTSTVSCRINGQGSAKNITFYTTATALQDVALNGTLVRGSLAYSQQRVIFTCVSKNSTILEWLSDDYIGRGGDVIPIYSVGSRDNVTSGGNPNTYATRVRVGIEDGITVIVSRLHIVASVPCFVTCRINGQGASDTIALNITDDTPPAPKLNSTLRKGMLACPGQTYDFECMVEVSYSLMWMSDVYIGRDGHFLEISSKAVRDIPKSSSAENSDTVASLKQITTQNRTLQLISSLRVRVSWSIVKQNHTVTCLNPSTRMEKSVIFYMADNCEETTTSDETTGRTTIIEKDISFNGSTAWSIISDHGIY